MRISEMFNGRQMADARVLIVDDEPLNVKLLVKLMERAELGEVRGVTDSREVMGTLEAFDPDVVLLDIHMPAPDGWSLLEMIKRKTPEDSYLPVVLLTADVLDETRERGLSMEAADFITKPFSAVEVVLRVKNQIRIRFMTEQIRRNGIQMGSNGFDTTESDRERHDRQRRIGEIANDADSVLTMVYQPIVDLDSGLVVGAEALSRFNVVPLRPPNEWFADAVEAGVDTQLEVAAIRKAIADAGYLPVHAHLAVNASPATVRSGALLDLVSRGCARQLVVELTGHDAIEDFAPLSDSMHRLRERGVRFAVDDTGTGFVSLSHLSLLQPEMIKLDRQMVVGIHDDPAKRALVRALVGFCEEMGSTLIAQGIEDQAELETLNALGVKVGQGYFLCRPEHLPIPELIDLEQPLGMVAGAGGRAG